MVYDNDSVRAAEAAAAAEEEEEEEWKGGLQPNSNTWLVKINCLSNNFVGKLYSNFDSNLASSLKSASLLSSAEFFKLKLWGGPLTCITVANHCSLFRLRFEIAFLASGIRLQFSIHENMIIALKDVVRMSSRVSRNGLQNWMTLSVWRLFEKVCAQKCKFAAKYKFVPEI